MVVSWATEAERSVVVASSASDAGCICFAVYEVFAEQAVTLRLFVPTSKQLFRYVLWKVAWLLRIGQAAASKGVVLKP